MSAALFFFLLKCAACVVFANLVEPLPSRSSQAEQKAASYAKLIRRKAEPATEDHSTEHVLVDFHGELLNKDVSHKSNASVPSSILHVSDADVSDMGVLADPIVRSRPRENISVTVDPDGNTLFEVVGKQESHGRAHDGPLENSERPRCERPAPKRNRHFLCNSPDCGPPPVSYMVAIANGHTMLESFASPADVMFDEAFNDERTKTELDTHMTPQRENCKCDGCDEWNEWAISQLTKPDTSERGYRHPDYEWKLIFAELNPAATYVRRERYYEGESLLIATKQEEALSVAGTGGLAPRGIFEKASNTMNAAKERAPETWQRRTLRNKNWTVSEGKPNVVWQYVLKCKVFNKYGMYINEARFGTNLFIQVDFTETPRCDPNTQTCSGCT